MKLALAAVLASVATGCTASGTVAPTDGGLGDDATLGLVNEADGMAVQPPAPAACSDPSHCLSGTANLDPLFVVYCPSPQCTSWQVDLFDTYPAAGVKPIRAPVLIAAQGSATGDDGGDDAGPTFGGWTFDQVGTDGGPSTGYYVQATALFVYDGGQSIVSSVAGPLALGSTGTAIDVAPLQAVASESRPTGGAMSLDWVLAHVFDPSSGAEITSDASVTVALAEGGAAALAPTPVGSSTSYYLAFANPPAAQSVYSVTASHPAFGDAGVTVQLVAAVPSFDGMIASVDAGAGGALTVAWTPQPQADYEVLEVYASKGDAGWTPSFASATPVPASQTSQTTGPLDAGTYLVNVAYTLANCPADAGGCVQASAVAATTTVVP